MIFKTDNMDSKKYVLEFIELMKSQIKDRPQCHHFALQLKGKFSDAVIYSSSDHCITRIDGEWYDWDGVAKFSDKFLPFPESYGDQHIVNHYKATEELFLGRNDLYLRDGLRRHRDLYRDAPNMPIVPEDHYVPDISEFGMGFEYKIWNDSYEGDKEGERLVPGTTWINRTVGMGIWDLQSQVKRLLDKGNICVKYLDREDVESFVDFECQNKDETLFANNEYELELLENNVVEVTRYYVDQEHIFKLTIKNKSQLKQILQWTQILK